MEKERQDRERDRERGGERERGSERGSERGGACGSARELMKNTQRRNENIAKRCNTSKHTRRGCLRFGFRTYN